MSDDTFQVRPAWPDAMIYAEGEARQIRLACLSPEEPPVLEVPAEARWREQMPAWARERRALIVADRKLYSVDASPPSRPLSELPRVLAYQAARCPILSPQLPKPAGSSWLLALGSIVLTAAGIWQLTCGVTLKDRVLGGLCAVFFGVSSGFSIITARTTWPRPPGART